ncbi:unnamed protein product [Protopolystoma xenopodis]|uniref:EGF-like domain-containing protein n=1 Tax=Protopolystoma xenopodis TaxID=117903 RepID=A0A3S5BNL9_9PLAT|nr:unnamed protein product [Protopolystoma xenopodis]
MLFAVPPCPVTDVCDPTTCLNGGRCSETSEGGAETTIRRHRLPCICPVGFYGSHCHLRVPIRGCRRRHAGSGVGIGNEMAPSGDANSGAASVAGSGEAGRGTSGECFCLPGWSGPNCEQSKSCTQKFCFL